MAWGKHFHSKREKEIERNGSKTNQNAARQTPNFVAASLAPCCCEMWAPRGSGGPAMHHSLLVVVLLLLSWVASRIACTFYRCFIFLASPPSRVSTPLLTSFSQLYTLLSRVSCLVFRAFFWKWGRNFPHATVLVFLAPAWWCQRLLLAHIVTSLLPSWLWRPLSIWMAELWETFPSSAQKEQSALGFSSQSKVFNVCW